MAFDINEFLVAPCSSDRSKCIFSFALGSEIQQLKEIVLPSHLKYAEKARADYYCFTKEFPGFPGSSNGLHQQLSGITYNKLAYAHALRDYKKILYVDMDVIISRSAPSIFSVYRSSRVDIVAFNESFVDPDGVIAAINDVVSFYGGNPWSSDFYFNSGVMLLSQNAASAFTVPANGFFIGKWSEQTCINWIIFNSGLSWHELDRRYNLLTTVSRPQSLKHSYFLHFAGTTSPHGIDTENEYATRNEMIMKSMSEFFYAT